MLLAALLLVLADGPANVGKSVQMLTEKQPTKHFVISYRPGSHAGATVDRTAFVAEREFDRIVETLALKNKVDARKPFYLFLYDNTDELATITGTTGNAGFSTARESHVPCENDQTLVHEMVHILLASVKPTGTEARNFFYVEGIANAVLRFVHGVPVHAVAAYEQKRGSLPALATMTGEDFYAFLQRNPGFNGYDVGGSFMLYLLDTLGAERTVNFSMGTPAAHALGKSLNDLEKDWHQFLAGFAVRPELEALLKERRGDTDAKPLTADVLGDDSEWESFLEELAIPEGNKSFRREKDRVIAQCKSASDWDLCEAPARTLTSGMLHARIKTLGPCWGVQLRIGKELQAMVLGQGSFIYFQEKAGIAFSDQHKLESDAEIDLLLRVQQGKAQVWLDGRLILEKEIGIQPGAAGIGLVGGRAEFRELKMRRLD